MINGMHFSLIQNLILPEQKNYPLTLQYKAAAPTRIRLYLDSVCAAEQTLPACAEIRHEAIDFSADAGFAALRLEIADGGSCAVYALKLESL